MSEIHGIVSGVFTIVLMVTFLAIWFWAWRPHHRRTFDALAGLPLEDLADGRSVPRPPARLARPGGTGPEPASPGDAAGRRSDSRAETPQREQAR